MKVLLFTDKSLHRYLAGGWNLKGLAEGKIGTLSGRSVSVNVPNERSAIKVLKRCLEDQEGWKAEDLVVYTTAGRKVDNKEILEDLGITSATSKAALILLVPCEEAEKPGQNKPIHAGNGQAFRPHTEGSRTITIQPEQDKEKDSEKGHSDVRPARSPAQRPSSQGTGGTPAKSTQSPGHVLGGTTRAQGASDSQDERRRRALAAAESRLRGEGGL